MTKATDLTYRVVKLPKKLRDSTRKQRDEQGVTNQEFVEAAVDTQLPVLLDNLRKLGFGFRRGNSVTARFPFSDKAKTLDKLRKVSNEVQVPSVRLLEICLESSVSAKRRGAPKLRTRRKAAGSAQQTRRRRRTSKKG